MLSAEIVDFMEQVVFGCITVIGDFLRRLPFAVVKDIF